MPCKKRINSYNDSNPYKCQMCNISNKGGCCGDDNEEQGECINPSSCGSVSSYGGDCSMSCAEKNCNFQLPPLPMPPPISGISPMQGSPLPPKLFDCKICWKAFSQRSHVSVHKQIHSAVLPYKCDLCEKSFPRLQNLERHKKTHEDGKLFNCEVCSKSFRQRSHLKAHTRVHSGERPFKCEVCGYAFSRNGNLARHNKMHRSKKKHLFENSSSENALVLPPKNASKKNGKLHKNGFLNKNTNKDCLIYKKGNLLDCAICWRVFSQRSHISVHRRIHKAVQPYQCSLCGKSFTQYGNMLRHKRLHMGERRFVCNVCPKAFTQRTHLKVHQRLHTGEMPFKCGICGFSFTRNGNLMRHMRLHSKLGQFGPPATNIPETGQAVFPQNLHLDEDDKDGSNCNMGLVTNQGEECDHADDTDNMQLDCGACWRNFTRSQQVSSSNKWMQTQLQTFACNICGKGFTNMNDLERHQRVHMPGAKRFPCEVCNKTFSQKSHMKAHMRIHTGERPYKCEDCGYSFSRVGNLIRHRRGNKKKGKRWSCVNRRNLESTPVSIPNTTISITSTTTTSTTNNNNNSSSNNSNNNSNNSDSSNNIQSSADTKELPRETSQQNLATQMVTSGVEEGSITPVTSGVASSSNSSSSENQSGTSPLTHQELTDITGQEYHQHQTAQWLESYDEGYKVFTDIIGDIS
ncbi:finger 665-like [Octopus vulgaris]|uniref:Finger 665-like n=1 Tax=Octopus vulgaris TaxID=6645 RepID=A0AA36BE38_OCTVU|nr:finger 665-like [Octopus vulgaris]